MEKVIVAFENVANCQRICDMLESGSVARTTTVHSAGEVKRLIARSDIGVVVCGYKFKDGSAERLYETLPQTCSMLVVAQQSQLDYLNEEIFRLPAPISKAGLCASVQMLFQMNRKMNLFLRPRRNEEEERIIREAKALLMDRNQMTEEQAHRWIQKKSMDTGAKLVQTARVILGDL